MFQTTNQMSIEHQKRKNKELIYFDHLDMEFSVNLPQKDGHVLNQNARDLTIICTYPYANHGAGICTATFALAQNRPVV